MSINNRFSHIIKTLFNDNKSAFANAIGVSPSVVENIVGKRQGKPSFDVVEKICAIENLNPTWLITGKGEMLKDTRERIIAVQSEDLNSGIPLIPVEAMAGFFTGEVSEYDRDCERLQIPGIKADFVVPVSGDSMEPKYYSGDLVACQMVNLSDIFFQWGKVYVIDTNQGVLIKKVKRSSKPGFILLISENPEYDTVEIPCSNIYHISMVKAIVRFT